MYHNGAKVKTSFVSNMFGDIGVIADPTYRREIYAIQQYNKPRLPKYIYPDNVVTVSRLAKIVERGGCFTLLKSDFKRVSALDDQRALQKGLFGGGYLISDQRAEELRAEEVDYVYKWRLSDNERDIIAKLGGQIETKFNF